MANNNLLGHTLEKFGMVTVLDARFYDVDCGDVLIEFDTLTVSNISAEGSQKEIRGGQGADLLLSYDYGRTANIEITDALASMYSLEYLWGGKLNNGDVRYSARKEITKDSTVAQRTVKAIPGTKYTVALYSSDDTATKTVSVVGPAEEGAALLDVVVPALTGTQTKAIVYYESIIAGGKAHVHELVLTSTDFPPVVRFVGETFLIDQTSGKKVPMQIEIPRFKLNANFTFTLEAEGDASVFDFSGVALSSNGELMKIRTLGEGDIDGEEEECVTEAIYPDED